jgi:pSer/pThr/pTyr-binding forkhead associated (FHA) protein
MNTGRDVACDLVLDYPTVSRVHARIGLGDEGQVSVLDNDSRNGTYLNRNENWIRVRKAILCVGDRIRFGEQEVSLDQLTAVFGNRANVRLGDRHFQLRHGTNAVKLFADDGPIMQKPKRNPETGKIEEDSI